MTIRSSFPRLVRPSPLPGFAPALTAASLWLGLIVLLPLAVLILRAADLHTASLDAPLESIASRATALRR